MIEPTPRAPDLEAGLAEIDRRLREIQDELSGTEPGSHSPERPAERRTGRSGPLALALQRAARAEAASPDPVVPPSPAPPPSPASPPAAGRDLGAGREELGALQHELAALSEVRDRLLSAIRELVEGYQTLAHAQPSVGRRSGGSREASAELTLSVGPFATLEEVHAFEQAVAALPGVRDTSLRGYEGSDRAIVDVRLARAEGAEASRDSRS